MADLTIEAARRHIDVGQALYSQGNPTADRQAALEFEQAVEIARTLQAHVTEGSALMGLGVVYDALGRPEEGLEAEFDALRIWRDVSERGPEGAALANIGAIYLGQQQLDDALEHYRQAVPILHEAGDLHTEGIALNRLQFLCEELRRPAEAVEYGAKAAKVWRAQEDWDLLTSTLQRLGRFCMSHDPAAAISYLSEALTLSRARNDADAEAAALQELELLKDATDKPKEGKPARRRPFGR